MFASQDEFVERLIQKFRDLEVITIVEKKALELNITDISN